MPELQRRLRFFSASALVVANMIGTGIFTTSGFIMEAVGSPVLLLLVWLVGGLFALAGALCYAELGVRLPRVGGEYAFLREGLGPLWGFLAGWVSLVVGFSAAIAASAMAFAAYALPLCPWAGFPAVELHLGDLTLLTVSPQTVLALAMIAFLSAVHAWSLAHGLWVQNLLTVCKVVVIVAFLGVGFAALPGWRTVAATHPAGSSVFSADFAVALIYVTFAYSGWNAATYLAGEIRNPARNLPRALVAGTLCVSVLYLLLNLLFVLALGPAQMRGVLAVGAKAATVLLGPEAGNWFSAAVAFFLISNAGAMIMAGPRVYYAMAVDGLFFGCLARVRRQGRSPTLAVLLQGAIAALLVVTTSFSWLLIYIGLSLSLFAMLTVLVLVVLRRRHPETGAYDTPGYPFTAMVFIAGNLWIVTHTLAVRPMAGLATLGTLLVGGIAYGWFKLARVGVPGEENLPLGRDNPVDRFVGSCPGPGPRGECDTRRSAHRATAGGILHRRAHELRRGSDLRTR